MHMIYNALQQRICIGKINTTDLFKVVPKPILHNVKGWWNRQQDRLDIRLYAFCKNVIDNGFVDPIILWYSDQKNEFAIHPGMNRIALNNVLNYNMKAWVISYDIKDYKRLGRVFPGITKLQLDDGILSTSAPLVISNFRYFWCAFGNFVLICFASTSPNMSVK